MPRPSERLSAAAPAHRAAELPPDPTFSCPGMCAGRTGCTPRGCALNDDEGASSWQHVQISRSRSNLMQADVSGVLASSAGCAPPMCPGDLWRLQMGFVIGWTCRDIRTMRMLFCVCTEGKGWRLSALRALIPGSVLLSGTNVLSSFLEV